MYELALDHCGAPEEQVSLAGALTRAEQTENRAIGLLLGTQT